MTLIRIAVIALALFVAAGWRASASTTSTVSESSGAAQAASAEKGEGDFTGLVDIGAGRRMYMECSGSGSPTVILESGLRVAADVWHKSSAEGVPPVFLEVANFTRVCAYDRPGTVIGGDKPGRSDSVSQPTTAQDAVADLHALLSAAQEPGPYVLVGHSYGGLLVRLYAMTYPQDVSGLVLIDALSEFLPAEMTPEQREIWEPLRDPHHAQRYCQVRRHREARLRRQRRTGTRRRARYPWSCCPPTGPGGRRFRPSLLRARLPPDMPPNFGYVIDAAQKAAQEALAKLVPNAEHITETNSGHDIHVEQPRLVIDAIRRVVDVVRK